MKPTARRKFCGDFYYICFSFLNNVIYYLRIQNVILQNEVSVMRKVLSYLLAILTVLLPLFTFTSCEKGKEKFTAYYFDYFDTATTVVGYENSQEDFDKVCEIIKSELNTYHRLFTIYTSYDNLNNLCTVNKVKDGNHQKIKVDKKIIDLLTFCKDFYNKTDGVLNVYSGSVLSIWRSYREAGMNDPQNAKIPPLFDLKEAAKHSDIDNVIIDEKNNTVFIADSQMTLDVGAVAKGYAVERVAETLEKNGVTGYVLNVGGNVRAIGNANGEPFKIGIENPDTDSEEKYIAYLKIQDLSLVTSGNYQRFYTVNGKNYHHIIDFETLMPGEKYNSVSVLTKDSGVADALSTTLFLLDLEDGKALVEAMENTEAMWVMPDGEIRYSTGFENYTY